MWNDFISQLLQLALTIAPLLLFGFAIAGLLHVLVRESFVIRHLGHPGWGSVLRATLIAVPLPLCSCSVVPVVASLKRKGASDGASVSFLIAAPQIGADSFLLTQGLLGLGFALYRIGAVLLTALSAGLMVDLDPDQAPATPASSSWQERRESVLAAFWQHIREIVGSLANNLLIGLAVAALILVILPDGLLTQWQGGNQWWAMLAMMALGVPLYVCATAATPIAAALVAKGLSPGAALVFLLTGPATNMVTLVLLRGSLRRRAFLAYLGAIMGVGLLAGWALNFFMPTATAELGGHVHQHEQGLRWLDSLALAALGFLLAWHYLSTWRAWRARSAADKGEGQMDENNMTLTVLGMTCSHCAGRVDKALRETGLPSDLAVDLASGRVRLTLTPGTVVEEARQQLIQAIIEAGYTVPEGSVTSS